MEIKTKFGINQIVKHKYSKNTDPNGIETCLEVMGVQTDSCYAGTQVFYLCRALQVVKHKKFHGPDKDKLFYQIIYGIGKEDLQIGWHKYREDELSSAQQELIDLIVRPEDVKE